MQASVLPYLSARFRSRRAGIGGEQSAGSPRGQKTHDARVAAGIPDETIRAAIHPSRGRNGWPGAEHDPQEGEEGRGGALTSFDVPYNGHRDQKILNGC